MLHTILHRHRFCRRPFSSTRAACTTASRPPWETTSGGDTDTAANPAAAADDAAASTAIRGAPLGTHQRILDYIGARAFPTAGRRTARFWDPAATTAVDDGDGDDRAAASRASPLSYAAREARAAAALAACRADTARLPGAGAAMQISPDLGALLQLLVRLGRCERALEIGTFSGYSALCVALALPAHGQIVALDHDPRAAEAARRHWRAAGVDHKVDLRLGPALGTLDALLAEEGQAGSFDFAFIDADKRNYPAYYERCLALLRPGGLVAVDNALWAGRVADAADATPQTAAVRAVNDAIAADTRVDSVSLLAVSDGLFLARKRDDG